MPAPTRARALRVLTLAAALAAPLGPRAVAAEDAPAAAATIYKWVDTNGIAHYTTDLGRVPRSVRGSVRALGSSGGSPADGFAARDASPTAAPAAAPAGATPTEWDQGGAGAAAAAGAPPAAGDEALAGTDRPAETPGEPDEAAAPTQTARAEAAVPAAPDPARAGDLDARIAALETEIASDEEALKNLLATPAPEDPAQIAYDRSFREVAERLPKRLAELRTLQSERAQLDQP